MTKKYIKKLFFIAILCQTIVIAKELVTPIPLKVTDVDLKKVKLGHELFLTLSSLKTEL